MVSGPLRFSSEALPISIRPSIRKRQQRHVPGLAEAAPTASSGPYRTTTRKLSARSSRHIGDGADETDPLALLGFPRVGSQIQRLLGAIALDAHAQGLAGMSLDQRAPLFPVADRFAPGPQDPVARLQAARVPPRHRGVT